MELPRLLVCVLSLSIASHGASIALQARGTLAAVELDKGDTCTFTLRSGQTRTLILEDTDARLLFTTGERRAEGRTKGATLYHFSCRLTVDGRPMTMQRYVGSQESFYEPYVVNGLRIWFDGVADIFARDVVTEHHGKCCPGKDARFALCDMTEDICPTEVQKPFDEPLNYIDARECFGGQDMWMGAYHGIDAHGGLDISMPIATPNFAPFPIDDHSMFSLLVSGSNNNRWRGWHTWENGDVWTFQNHHMVGLLVPEHEPIAAGQYYADAAGIHSGAYHHAHYVFRVKHAGDSTEVVLDPWILLWQAFENARNHDGRTRAVIAPVSPGTTGTPVTFSGVGSVAGSAGRTLSHYWTFGDGGWSDQQAPEHTYSSPGIYPVTLTVDDGVHRAAFTQHITIDGDSATTPVLVLSADDEPSFRPRPVHAMDTYGVPPEMLPHCLRFVARPTRPEPAAKVVRLCNIGGKALAQPDTVAVVYRKGTDWLRVEHSGKRNAQRLSVAVDARGLPAGNYSAVVYVTVPHATNGTQGFAVELSVPLSPPVHLTVDNAERLPGRFYCTPYFWVSPSNTAVVQGYNNWRELVKHTFLTNGGRARKGEFARFTPDLEAGRYRVAFAKETPFEPQMRAAKGVVPVDSVLNPDSRFMVRVKRHGGVDTVWAEPHRSRTVGEFEFDEGMDGFVEILAENSSGQVMADAVVFEPLK